MEELVMIANAAVEPKNDFDAFRLSRGVNIFEEQLAQDGKGITISATGRRFIFRRHCGQRMKSVSCSDRAVRAIFEFRVCEKCGFNKLRFSWSGMG